MLKDITIGQFFPGNSVVHRLDSRIKIILTTLYITMLFAADTFLGLAVGAIFFLLVLLLSQIPVKMVIKGLKPIIPIIIFTAVLNIFFLRGGETLVKWWIITITSEGLRMSAFMIIRVLLLIGGTSLLTYTTSPITLTDAIERLLSPLKKIKVPVHELAMMMTIALRFIPTIIEETDKIMSAQKARGADLETGGLIKRAKALVPILIPLFVSSFRRAEELALAMECRCYRGGEGRTRLRQLKIAGRDFSALIVTLMFLTAIIILNIIY